MFLLFFTKMVGQKLTYLREKLTRMIILILSVTIQNIKRKTYKIWLNVLSYFISDEARINERLSELKTALSSPSYLTAIIKKYF